MEMNPYAWILLITAIISVSVGLYVLNKKPGNAPAAFPALMFSLGLWSLTYGFEVASIDLKMMRFWVRIEYLGIATLPVLLLIFILQYSGKKHWLTRHNVMALFIIPFLTVILNATNEFHHLYYAAVEMDRHGPIPLQALTPGPGYWLHVVYSYSSIIAGAVFLLHMWLHTSRLYRNQIGIVLIGISVPFLLNLLYLSGIRPFKHLDITPFAFTITGLVITFGLFRYKFLDLMPLARSILFENFSDGFIVLDANHRIVDINPAAKKMFKALKSAPTGQEIQIALNQWPQLFSFLETDDKSYFETTLDVDFTLKLNIRFSPLYDHRKNYIGGMLILRNITDLKKAEDDLQKSNERMEMLLHSIPQGIIIIDEETHKIIDVNPQAALMIGSPVEQMVGRVCHNFICPFLEGKCPISISENKFNKTESVLLTAQGEKIPILKTVLSVQIDGQNCLVECFSDISEMKNAESDRLEKEKLQAIIEMAGAICHELNQPLMGALGYADLLLLDMENEETVQENARKIEEQIQRMGKITKKLMEITRYKTKKYLDTQIIDIN